MKYLKVVGTVLIVIVLALLLAYQFRTDPIGILSGKRLSGLEVGYPADWSFSNDFETIAVEVRPEQAYSVTTYCIVKDGMLVILSLDPSEKDWPKFVAANPNVRIKVGESVYPAALTRFIPTDQNGILIDFAAKYPRIKNLVADGSLPDIWFYQTEPRKGG